MKRVINIIVLVFSLTSLVFSYIYRENIFFTIGGFIFYTFLFALIHELSHVLGAKMTKGQVNSFQTFFVFYKREEGVSLLNSLTIRSQVKFVSKKSKVVYLMGLLISLLLLGWPIAEMFLLYSFHSIFYLFLYATLLVILFIPRKESDIYKLFSK